MLKSYDFRFSVDELKFWRDLRSIQDCARFCGVQSVVNNYTRLISVTLYFEDSEPCKLSLFDFRLVSFHRLEVLTRVDIETDPKLDAVCKYCF